MNEAYGRAWPGSLEHYWWVHSASELRRNWKDCQFYFLSAVLQNQQNNVEAKCRKALLEKKQMFWGIQKSSTENQTQIWKIITWEKLWRFVEGFIIDPCAEENITGEPLIFVSTSLASGKDAVPLSQCNCPNLHQLSFCFFVCVALSATLARESKHSLFFPGSKKSHCRRIPKLLYLLFHFCDWRYSRTNDLNLQCRT